MRTNRRDTALAAQAWQRMFEFLVHLAPRRIEALQRHGLTPNDGCALFAISGKPGTPQAEPQNGFGLNELLSTLRCCRQHARVVTGHLQLHVNISCFIWLIAGSQLVLESE